MFLISTAMKIETNWTLAKFPNSDMLCNKWHPRFIWTILVKAIISSAEFQLRSPLSFK